MFKLMGLPCFRTSFVKKINLCGASPVKPKNPIMAIQEDWQQFTVTETEELAEASKQLHYGAQFVAAFGHYLLPESADDSQSSMHWVSGLRALAGQEVNLKQRVRMALAYGTFELMLINENEEVLGSFPLSGQTKTTAISFVRTQARSLGVKQVQEIDIPSHYELPPHPIREGAPFQMTSPAHHQELARYRHNAQLLLQAIANEYEYATPVATWLHHFDTGSVINVKFDDQGNSQKTIGIGLAVPDALSDEHYFYVNHWREKGGADYSTLPSLPGNAQWKTEGWTGAILPVSELVKAGDAAAQCELAEDFFRQGIKASLDLLEEASVKA